MFTAETLSENTQPEVKPSIASIFLLFLKIGSLAFGGFMALVSVIQKEVCEKRKLLPSEKVVDGVSLASLLPGPIAVNVATYTGYSIAGIGGAAAAWLGVILPSFFLMIIFAMFYAKYGSVPAVQGIFSGIAPAVIAVIASVAIKLYQNSVKAKWQSAIAFTALIVFSIFDRLWVALVLIFFSALLGLFSSPKTINGNSSTLPTKKLLLSIFVLMAIIGFAFTCSEIARRSTGLSLTSQLGITFGGLSLAMFGGGYVFVPMLREVVVDNLAWLTPSAFTDAIAMGQITPGPIMISATFIGFTMAGLLGAVVATAGMFLPSAVLMVWLSHVQSLVVNMPSVQRAYAGIRPCVVGMIGAAAIVLGRSVDFSTFSLIILVISLVATIRYKVDVLYLIPAAGALGYVVSRI